MKNKIHLNQVGYITNMPKSAVVTVDTNQKFFVCRKKDGTIAYTGRLTDYINDVASGEKTTKADFSDMTEEGDFYIKVGSIISPTFRISKNPFSEIKDDVLKSFYYARCGQALDDAHAGDFSRDECHMSKPSVISEITRKIDVSGGWHDSGDYGKYIVSAANALAILFYSYFFGAASFNRNINIPESENEMPDILNQCKYELDWLLKMQDKDGGVFSKVASLEMAETVMPADDTQEQFIFDKSCDATLSFCAVAARASGIYEKYDKVYSDRLKNASIMAWIWAADQGLSDDGKRRSAGIDDNKYYCEKIEDKIFWAASELYTLFGEQPFHETMTKLYDTVDTTTFYWNASGGFGALSYIFNNRPKDDVMLDVLKTSFVYRADNLVSMSKHSGYSTALAANKYVYGSNMDICISGITLIAANRIHNNEEYIKIALEELNYILGKNPMGICYITGYGEYHVQHPHHRPCTADGIDECIKGLLVGGANMLRGDEYCKWVIPKSTPPAKCYVDKEHSYAVNDTTIFFNAAAVGLLAYFSDNGRFKEEQED